MNNQLTIRQSKTQSKTMTASTSTRLGALLAAAALALAGCGTTVGATDGGADGSASSAGQSVAIADGWVKAAGSGMSAAFGGLTNSGSGDVTVVSATTEASSMLELHETVENEAGEMIMREIEGGFVIPAGDTLSLEPGGNHIMLMDLTDPLEAGEEVAFTLTFSDESTYEFTVPVKDYSGANENYVGGDPEPEMGDADAGADGTGTEG
ncbi:copper chaperone PCu(A)C [Promicromonospora panici]|uniref:copper chaperone PCu(A)C n=1 Tax=Promicromonospora panici TaxID=2219658 RepID=UPI001F5D43E0|nr:copper chaperone PCu(A)C [Promicromonospora panici]